jgi:hypothetical protein
MNDADDLDMDDVDDGNEFDELESRFINSELSTKRDVRSEIERRLELMELRKLMGDPFYDEVFD